jgi:hypothetical protein
MLRGFPRTTGAAALRGLTLARRGPVRGARAQALTPKDRQMEGR